MKYSVLIINSNNICDYVLKDSISGIRYNNLEKYDVDQLIRLSLEQNFSVVVQREEGE